MKIYTKKGDTGSTDLYQSGRAPKHDQIFELLGSLDEMNAEIGVCLVFIPKQVAEKHIQELEKIQKEIIDICSTIASVKKLLAPITNFGIRTQQIESLIDELTSELPKLNEFISPGGFGGAAFVHRLRTITRRCERKLWVHIRTKDREFQLKDIAKYLNRLSDYFFQLGRYLTENSSKDIQVTSSNSIHDLDPKSDETQSTVPPLIQGLTQEILIPESKQEVEDSFAGLSIFPEQEIKETSN